MSGPKRGLGADPAELPRSGIWIALWPGVWITVGYAVIQVLSASPRLGSVTAARPGRTCPPTAIRAAVARSNADRSNPPSPGGRSVEQGPCDVALWLTSPAKPFLALCCEPSQGRLIYC